MADPRWENRWSGPSTSGCVEGNFDSSQRPPRSGPSNLRDAAFYSLVMEDSKVAASVKAELLAQARISGVDFSNRSRWCPGKIRDINPGFEIANWLTKLLYAYDYLGSDQFSASERALLNAWFYEAANFWRIDLNADLNRLFSDRWNGDYKLTSTGSSTSSPRVGYFGGKPTYSIHRYYNNRRGQIARFVGVTGIKLTDEGFTDARDMSVAGLRKTAKLWVKEWVTYSVFPEGFFGDFQRWTDSAPDRGWQYGVDALVPTLTIADAFARAGDRELIDFSTKQGALGTQATSSQPDKSLLFAVQSIGRYVDGSYARYGTNQSSRNGRQEYRIDSIETQNNWFAVSDIQVAPINIHYGDSYITSMYRRSGKNMPGYPSKTASTGQHLVWTGDWGTFPATLFMYGK